MFNTKPKQQLTVCTDKITDLYTKYDALEARFNSYVEKTKPAAKFKLYDDVVGEYHYPYVVGCWTKPTPDTFTGKIIDVQYNTTNLTYVYTIKTATKTYPNIPEQNVKLDTSKYFQFSLVCDPTRWTTDHIDIGFRRPTAKLPKKPARKSAKAKR